MRKTPEYGVLLRIPSYDKGRLHIKQTDEKIYNAKVKTIRSHSTLVNRSLHLQETRQIPILQDGKIQYPIKEIHIEKENIPLRTVRMVIGPAIQLHDH